MSNPFPQHTSEAPANMSTEQVEWTLNQIMMALGTIPDFSDWYAWGDELP